MCPEILKLTGKQAISREMKFKNKWAVSKLKKLQGFEEKESELTFSGLAGMSHMT